VARHIASHGVTVTGPSHVTHRHTPYKGVTDVTQVPRRRHCDPWPATPSRPGTDAAKEDPDLAVPFTGPGSERSRLSAGEIQRPGVSSPARELQGSFRPPPLAWTGPRPVPRWSNADCGGRSGSRAMADIIKKMTDANNEPAM
jgi:hypothetical protein